MDIADKVLKLTSGNKIDWTEITQTRLSGNIGNFTVTIKLLSGDYASYYLEVYKDSERFHGQPIETTTVDRIRVILQKRRTDPIVEEFMNL